MDSFDIGIAGFLSNRADAMQHIDAAIAASDRGALPLLVKAWMLHGGRDANAKPDISLLFAEAEKYQPAAGNREFVILTALELAIAGDGVQSATVMEQLLIDRPTDILVHQLIHEEIFWTGQSDWMRAVVERAAPAWHSSMEGYGAFLSIRAFANEEAGYLDEAERFGRMAIEIDASDIWGAHAVAHALYMKGDMDSGLRWLEGLSANWLHGNQMRHHLWWHICLFLLELGQHERVLALLHTEIRNPQSTLVQATPAAPIDIQNFASLLLRLELSGVDVGDNWQTLATICADRVHNHGNAFGSIHDMMVLVATGQFEKANELLANIRQLTRAQSGSQGVAYYAAGIPACQALIAHSKQDYAGVLFLLGGARYNLSLLGASHAQRDVLYQLLIHATKQLEEKKFQQVLMSDIERIGFQNVSRRAAYR